MTLLIATRVWALSRPGYGGGGCDSANQNLDQHGDRAPEKIGLYSKPVPELWIPGRRPLKEC